MLSKNPRQSLNIRTRRSRRKEWFDEESFWRDVYPFMFPDTRFAEAATDIEQALQLTEPKGTSVLDLCCGPGRCSIALAHLGFRVTGVDRTKYLLDKARLKAKEAGVKIEWVHKDMRDFVRPGAYSLILSMFTSFGYFEDKRDDIAVLKNMHESLVPGGTCLIDMMGKERLAKVLQGATAEVLTDGTMVVRRNQIIDDWTRLRNEITILRGESVKRFVVQHTVYSGQELKDRMCQAGFADVRLYGALTGGEYGVNAQALVAVAHKPMSRRRAE